jgi:hypothetical protein
VFASCLKNSCLVEVTRYILCFFHNLHSGESSTMVALTALVGLTSSYVVGQLCLHLV